MTDFPPDDEEEFDDEEGLDGEDDGGAGGDSVDGMQGAPVGAGVSPTWTWGSSTTVNLGQTSGFGAFKVGAQLAQVSLPEPANCSIYCQAALRVTDPVDVVGIFTLNLNEGIGRTTVPRQLSFANQPAISAPLEFTVPFMPVHALNVDVQIQGVQNSVVPTNVIAVDIYFVIAPFTRIPQKVQQIQFGMAMPGEADDLDDELRQDLEAEGPTAQAAVMQGRQRVDGSNDHVRRGRAEPEQQQPEEGVQRAPAWLLQVVDQLANRYGRQPTRTELKQAVQRLRARRARRLGARGR